MQLGEYIRLDFRPIQKGGGEKIVKLSNPNEDRIVVIVKSATRDKATGKFTYKTEKSVDVFQAKPEEVIAVIEKGLAQATGESVPVTPAPTKKAEAPTAKK
jgi:5-deoxy-D-glucuronate isomerase